MTSRSSDGGSSGRQRSHCCCDLGDAAEIGVVPFSFVRACALRATTCTQVSGVHKPFDREHTSALAVQTFARGHSPHFGFLGVHTVAPRSMSAWLSVRRLSNTPPGGTFTHFQCPARLFGTSSFATSQMYLSVAFFFMSACIASKRHMTRWICLCHSVCSHLV